MRPDGRRVEAELDARAGLAAGLHVVVLRETTERRRLAAQIVQAERMEAAGQLAGGIAHDFNNLLTVIVGHGESALERVEDEEVREDLQQLLKASLRAASLTHQLLAFGRRQVLALEILDLGEILRDLGPLLQRLVGEGVKVEVDADTEIRPIRADRAQLEQVLVNLAANARDAMPAGGTLRVAIREAPSAGGGRACVLLEVSDDGEGMDEHTREHAFEPFFTTKEVGRGTGLGLSSVHGTLQQLDGEIRLESEPGRGTRFEILLPRAEHAPRPERVRAAAEAPAGSGECVLLVEDDPLVRASVRSTLERCGYRVCPSASGEEALERLEEGADEVDLVVTDAVMPGIGGGDLAREVGRRWPRIKVLVISGHADDALVRQGLSPGGPAFLKKPFTSAVLVARLRELLDSGS